MTLPIATTLSPSEVHARLADPRIDDILARLDAPGGGYDGFIEAVKGAGCCRRPLRLQGRVTRIEGATRTVTFDTRVLPDRVLLKACGSRRETLCPPCSSVYRADAFQLVAAGLRGGKGVDESVADHPAVLVTLTAPSFGAVHRRGKDGRCHPRRWSCRHGVSLTCAKHHGENDRLLGQALCASCYDHEGAVLFNLSVSELWRRTSIYILRALGELAGLSVRQVGRVVRLSYIKVVEFQRRGLSISTASSVWTVPRRTCPLRLLCSTHDCWRGQSAIAVAKVHAPMAGESGRQAAARALGPSIRSNPYHRSQLTNEAVRPRIWRSTRPRRATPRALSITVSAPVSPTVDLPPQLRHLVRAAWALGSEPRLEQLHLRSWAHTLGFRGHFATKSRLLLDHLRGTPCRSPCMAGSQGGRRKTWGCRRTSRRIN